MKDTQINFRTKVLDNIRFFFRFPLMEHFLIKLKGATSIFAKLIPNHYQYKINSFRTFNRRGINFKADISEWLGYCAYFNVNNDPYDELFSLVKPGMMVIDAGANMGFTALNIANKLKNKGIVYAFEPDAHNYSVLQNNLLLNPGLQIEPFKLGLGNIKEDVKLEVINESNRGENQITTNPSTPKFSIVAIITLDDFIAEQQIEKVDLIKIDTEGFEMNILKGATETITKNKPVLFIELNDNNLRKQLSSPEEVVALILSWGYKVISAQTGESINNNSKLRGCHIDIVCTI